MSAMIDTLKVARNFEGAGFAKAQAETLASVIGESLGEAREDLVTKDFLRGEAAVLKSELRSELAGVKNELIRWVLGSQVMVLAVLVALANFTRLLG